MSTLQSPPAEQPRLVLTEALICALQQATAAVTSAKGLNDVLGVILDACAGGLGYDSLSVALLRSKGDRLIGRCISFPTDCTSMQRVGEQVNVQLHCFLGPRGERRSEHRSGSGKVPPDALSYRTNAADNLVVQVYLKHVPQVTSSYYDIVRPHLQASVAAEVQQALGIGSIALLPLIAAECCLGVLAVAAAPGRVIADLDLRVLELFANLAAMAVENARLHVDLRDREQQVSLLLKATIDAQEEERERICMDIHDGVAQTLAAAFHYLQTLDRWPGLPDELRANVSKAGMLVRNASREAREVIATLRPAALDTLGLVATVRYEMEELRERMGWTVDFDADQMRFPKAIETALYRIVHEALSNVTKHAHARHVTVRVKQAQGLIVAEVQDDGIGFDVLAVKRQVHRKGVGLLSMRKRAELLHGSFHVRGSPGEGTRVRVEVPLPAREEWQGGQWG